MNTQLTNSPGEVNTGKTYPAQDSHLWAEASRAPAEEMAEAGPLKLKLRNILVPLDFSYASEKALRYAVAFASQFGARITLIYVSHAQFSGNEFGYLPIEEAGMDAAAREQLEAIARRSVSPKLFGGVLVRNGVPFEEIARAAQEINADIIIVNTHGYTGMKHILIGSTAECIIRHAPCPVLVVREREHEFV